ncbi:MAG: hypothetical protein HUU60_12725 [Armatimonadetes bacterium]|nr:hypothetical protein [Armatimonadota bacterium]
MKSTQFLAVLSLALSLSMAFAQQDYLVVSCYGTGDIARFDGTTGLDGSLFGSQVCSSTGNLYGITAGPDGHLYIADYNNAEIKRFDGRTGLFMDTFVPAGTSTLMTEPIFLKFGPDGNLYVSDYAAGYVMRFDGATGAALPADGQIDAIFVDTGVINAGGNRAGQLDFGPDGNLYACSWDRNFATGGVYRFDGTTGALIDLFVADGSGGLANSWTLDFGLDGNLYIAEYILGGGGVYRYSGADGSFMDVFVQPGDGGQSNTYDMAFGPNGDLYLTSLFHEGGDDQVRQYSGADGSFVGVFSSGPPINGATGLAFYSAEPVVPGDVNLDGCVDDTDLAIILEAFGGSGCALEDIDKSGIVDDTDLAIVLENFGLGC